VHHANFHLEVQPGSRRALSAIIDLSTDEQLLALGFVE